MVSPLLSNILLTPFDQEMRRKGYQLTRYADDWVVTCESTAEARAAVAAALRILNELGVQLHPQKTRIVHVRQGFEFLGYKIKRGRGQLRLLPGQIRSGTQPGALYAYPREKSIRHFMDQVRVPLRTKRADRGTEPGVAGMGTSLPASPCPKALPPARRLDCAAHLVASIQAVAERWLATVAENQAVWRVRAGQLDSVDPFDCISEA